MKSPFFTWVDQAFASADEVPHRLREQIKILYLKGAKPDELAATFKIPQQWVEEFVLRKTTN